MKHVIVNIEIGRDGTYNAYLPEDTLPFGALGEGHTAEEAKLDFLGVVDSYREDYEEELVGTQFEFRYDLPSFMEYYAGIFTVPALSRITGIAKGQLSRYMCGNRKPSVKTVEKIQRSVSDFARSLAGAVLL